MVPSSVCELIEHQMGELSDAIADTVDLLSVAEPLTLRMLVDIVGRTAVEQVEERGLIIVDGRDEPVVQLAHPLYGEVRRLRAGHIRLRRLCGAVASRLEPEGDARHVLRRGTLQLESDIVSTAQDMLRAGEAALWSGDTGLALRFAQAAAAVGAGWPASIARADAHTMAGELDEAETLLVEDDPSRDARLHLALGLARNFYLQGRTEDARAVLRQAPADDAGSLSAMYAFLDACGGDFAAATTAADAALQRPGIGDFSKMLAATAKTIAAGEQGRVDDLALTVAFARTLGETSPSTGLLRFALAEAHCSALQLFGSPGATDVVESVRDDDQPADVYRWVAMMAGSVNLSHGRVDLAVRQLRDALSAHRPAFFGGWLCRYYVDLAIALAVRGEADAAEQCLNRLASVRRPETAWFEPMEMLATAWISAATGAVTRAIGEARSAAVTAASRGQAAREVLCLQMATRFGDTTTVTRLGELVRLVGGARATVAAQHAAALAAGDGDGLMAVSTAHEEIGDLLSGGRCGRAGIRRSESGKPAWVRAERDEPGARIGRSLRRCPHPRAEWRRGSCGVHRTNARSRDARRRWTDQPRDRRSASAVRANSRGTPLPRGGTRGCSRSQRIGAGDRPCSGDSGLAAAPPEWAGPSNAKNRVGGYSPLHPMVRAR